MAITLCPIAIAVGCRKCPVFKVCPLKSVIGDQPSAADKPPSGDEPTIQPKRKAKSRGKRRGGRGRPYRRGG
jgi:hypothetical protein